MNDSTQTREEAEEVRRSLLADLSEDLDSGWQENYGAGTFGQHELLDRTFIAGDMVEDLVLSHPACVLNPEWFRLAHQATEALHELYQAIGAASGADDEDEAD